MFRLFHFLTYLVYRLGAGVVGLLPLEPVFRLGGLCGAGAFHLLPGPRRIALENLTRAFSGEKSPAEIRALGKEHFRLLGANLLSSFKLAVMPPDAILARITVEIPDSVAQRRLASRSGWVAMLSHLGNWEIYAQLRHLLPEFRLGAVYHPVRNRYIDSHLRRQRSRFGVELFDRRSGLAKASRFLRGGGVVGVLIDQYAGSAGVWTPFFGRLASTSPLAATLAGHAAAPILPLAVYTIGAARWRVAVSSLIEAPDEEANLQTALLNRRLEEQIREAPSDWLWAHNRWKTPQPHFLFGYHQRGVAVPPGPLLLQPFRILIVSPPGAENAEAAIEAVRAIEESRPDAVVTILATAEAEPVWNKYARRIRILPFDLEWSLLRLARAIGGIAPFDAAFLFSRDSRIAAAVWLAGIPVRVGTARGLPALFANRRVPTQALSGEPGFYLELAHAAGANTESRAPERWSGLEIKLHQ